MNYYLQLPYINSIPRHECATICFLFFCQWTFGFFSVFAFKINDAADSTVCALVVQLAGICGQSAGEEGAIPRKAPRNLHVIHAHGNHTRQAGTYGEL